MRARILIIGLAAILGTGVAAVTGAPEQQNPQLTIEEVTDNLYNIIGSGGNVAALVTSDGVILIDDKFEQNYDEIIRCGAGRLTMLVEPVFGQTRECRGFRRFSFRGLENVRAEWQLVCLTHNILKLFRYGGGFKPLAA